LPVVLATDLNIPDILAVHLCGPLIFVTWDAIMMATATKRASLKPDRIVILGSTDIFGDRTAAFSRSVALYAVQHPYYRT
jgi:hypothetical protein